MPKSDGPVRTTTRSVSLHLTLPEPLAERLAETAKRLHVSRSLIGREALERGLKPATDSLRAKLRRMRGADSGARSDAGSGASADTVPVRRWSVEATAIAAIGASLLAALLVPLRADVRELRGDVAQVRAAVHALAERVARIEGALTGPYRLPPPAPEADQ